MSAKAKKAVEKVEEAPVAPKESAKSVERKINKDELISLQKEGKLASYDPTTGMGTVLSKGKNVTWPGGEPKVV